MVNPLRNISELIQHLDDFTRKIDDMGACQFSEFIKKIKSLNSIKGWMILAQRSFSHQSRIFKDIGTMRTTMNPEKYGKAVGDLVHLLSGWGI